MEEVKAKNKGMVLKAILCIGLYFGLDIILSFLPGTVISATAIWYAIMIPVCLWAFRHELKQGFIEVKSKLKTYFKTVLKYYAQCYLIQVLANVVLAFILEVEFVSENQLAIESLPMLFVVPMAVVFAPIVEELVFRASIRKLVKNNGAFIIISGLIFCQIHIVSEIISLNVTEIFATGLPYLIIGLCLANAYVKTNNILVSIGMHMLQNIIGVLGILFM